MKNKNLANLSMDSSTIHTCILSNLNMDYDTMVILRYKSQSHLSNLLIMGKKSVPFFHIYY